MSTTPPKLRTIATISKEEIDSLRKNQPMIEAQNGAVFKTILSTTKGTSGIEYINPMAPIEPTEHRVISNFRY